MVCVLDSEADAEVVGDALPLAVGVTERELEEVEVNERATQTLSASERHAARIPQSQSVHGEQAVAAARAA